MRLLWSCVVDLHCSCKTRLSRCMVFRPESMQWGPCTCFYCLQLQMPLCTSKGSASLISCMSCCCFASMICLEHPVSARHQCAGARVPEKLVAPRTCLRCLQAHELYPRPTSHASLEALSLLAMAVASCCLCLAGNFSITPARQQVADSGAHLMPP